MKKYPQEFDRNNGSNNTSYDSFIRPKKEAEYETIFKLFSKKEPPEKSLYDYKYTSIKELIASMPEEESLFDLNKNPSKISYPTIEGCYKKHSLTEFLKNIESENNPIRFKEVMLSILQLYFDGLVEEYIETEKNPELWKRQEETLQAIMKGVQLTVSQFYLNNQCIPFSDVKDAVMPYEEMFIKYGSQSESKERHMAQCEDQVGAYAKSIVKALQGKNIDLIVPIASGGFEPALLTADYLGIGSLFPVRFSKYSRTDSRTLVPSQAPEDYSFKKLGGKNVLFVDDIVASGNTAKEITRYIKGFNPASVYFGVVVAHGRENVLNEVNLKKSPASEFLYIYDEFAV